MRGFGFETGARGGGSDGGVQAGSGGGAGGEVGEEARDTGEGSAGCEEMMLGGDLCEPFV